VTDVILIAVIVAFFVAGALLVRVLDHMIAHAGSDSDPGDDASEPGTAGGAR
jgi:hypothetical protein